MKVQLAELKNKWVKDVVQALTTMTPDDAFFGDEVDDLHDQVVFTKLKVPEPQHGVVAAFLKSELQNPTSLFVKACGAVKLPPTKRQASKWLHQKGLAYRQGRFGGE